MNIFFFSFFVEGVSLVRDRIDMILNDVGQRILFDLALDEISLVSWLGNLSSYG